MVNEASPGALNVVAYPSWTGGQQHFIRITSFYPFHHVGIVFESQQQQTDRGAREDHQVQEFQD